MEANRIYRGKRIKVSLFEMTYMILYVSLFLNDVYQNDAIVYIARFLKIIAYVNLVICIYFERINTKKFIRNIIILLLASAYGIITGDFYFTIMIMLLSVCEHESEKRIINISMKLLIFATLIVLLLCMCGLLPNVATVRNTHDLNSKFRYAFGFYHSNVLPLIVMYLELYYIYLNNTNLKIVNLLTFLIIQIVLFIFCNSRNAFAVATLTTIFALINMRVPARSGLKKIYEWFARHLVVILSIFSLAMTYLITLGGIWDKIDYLFSGRFRLGTFKIRRIGLHLFNIMSNSEFMKDNIVYATGDFMETLTLDNGFLYAAIRYGILWLIFYFYVWNKLGKRNKDKINALLVLIFLAFANFSDNDLVDYSFLPFIVCAFSHNSIEKINE